VVNDNIYELQAKSPRSVTEIYDSHCEQLTLIMHCWIRRSTFALFTETAITKADDHRFGKAYARWQGHGRRIYGRYRRRVAITKYGHQCGKGSVIANQERIRIVEAGHPIPDENGVKATGEIIRLLTDADDKTLWYVSYQAELQHFLYRRMKEYTR